MHKFRKLFLSSAIVAAGGSLAWLAGLAPVTAADHFDPPQRVDPTATSTPDLAADIGDLYTYHTATSMIVAFPIAGPRPSGESARYDRDVDYNVFISNAGATTDPEYTINVRFGQDRTNPAASGIRVSGIPGTTAPVIGAVESTLTSGNVKVFAGLRDDPFNFDVVGFMMTRQTGTLSFDNTRNRFAGMNSTFIVIEFPLSAVQNGTNRITTWATSARIIPA